MTDLDILEGEFVELDAEDVPEYVDIVQGADFWYEQESCYQLAVISDGCIAVASGGQRPDYCNANDNLLEQCPFFIETADSEM